VNAISSINLLYSLSGFAVGFLVGQTGVGGGSLMTPLLVLLFGIHPATAVGTDLLYASVTKSAGTLVHGMNHSIDWRITRLLACGSVPMAIATLLVISRFNLMGPGSGRAISTVLGIALLLTSLALIFRNQIVVFCERWAPNRSESRTAVWTVAMGATLGILVTLTSVGAGALGVTALIILYPRLPIRTIVGSDIAHAVPLTMLAGIGHWWLGSVDWLMLTSLLLGSIPGIMIGSHLAKRMPDGLLRLVLAATLALVGGRLAF
jgi:uncharacterized protein